MILNKKQTLNEVVYAAIILLILFIFEKQTFFDPRAEGA
jgi:hypothetical protein